MFFLFFSFFYGDSMNDEIRKSVKQRLYPIYIPKKEVCECISCNLERQGKLQFKGYYVLQK